MHPHNYYLEILTELGLLVFYYFNFFNIYNLLLKIFLNQFKNNNLIIPFIFYLLQKFFLLKLLEVFLQLVMLLIYFYYCYLIGFLKEN